MTRRRISAVIATFNRSAFLRSAIESALEQSLPCDELIVVDHGSTDDSREIVASFGDEVTYLSLEQDPLGRPAVSRNAGLRAANGDLICFLDDDDLWEAGKNKHQTEVFEQDPDVGLVCTDALKIDADGKILAESYLAHTSGASGFVLERLLKDNFVIASSVMAPRKALLEIGGFNEHSTLRAFEDYELWLRLASRHRVAFLTEQLVRYRVHEAKLSRPEIRHSFAGRGAAMRQSLRDPATRGHLPLILRAIVREQIRRLAHTVREMV